MTPLLHPGLPASLPGIDASAACLYDDVAQDGRYIYAARLLAAYRDEDENEGAGRSMSWLNRLSRLKRLGGAAKRLAPPLAMTLVVVGLIMTLYGVSQARSHGATAQATDQATVAATPSAVASQPPVSVPTPTAPTDGQPIPPSNGSGQFLVQSVAMEPWCPSLGNSCRGEFACATPMPTYQISGMIWLAPNAPNGDITYRWIPNYGPATTPEVIHFGGGVSNVAPFYKWTPDPATSDGRPFSVRLEVLSPNTMISQPSPDMYVICQPLIKNVYVSPAATTRAYDCQAGGSQSFAYTASLDIAPSPSFAISYYWKRSNGSVSQMWTSTTTAGATSVSLHGDSISLTAPSPPPPVGPSPIASYGDTLVVLNPANAFNRSSIQQFTLAGANVLMPNCSDTPAPTPTATP